MPLRDHFHPPVKHLLGWDTLHSAWATHLADVLNERWLPPEFVAQEHRHGGGHLEIDVATYERLHAPAPIIPPQESNGPATATLPQLYAPPAAIRTMPGVFPDEFEVRVFNTEGGHHLVAAIELISPGNKDRPDVRRAFAAKCAAYLQEGVSLVIVDVVTERRANLHNEIVNVMEARDEYLMPADSSLYAVAYRPQYRRSRGTDRRHGRWPIVVEGGRHLRRAPRAGGSRKSRPASAITAARFQEAASDWHRCRACVRRTTPDRCAGGGTAGAHAIARRLVAPVR